MTPPRYAVVCAYYPYPWDARLPIRRFTLPFLVFATVDDAYRWIMTALERVERYEVQHHWYEVQEVNA